MQRPSPRIERLRIKGYRSVDDWLEIRFPRRAPLVLIGENNAGKSNVMRALALVLGEGWPGNHLPEDHEFYGRNADGAEIVIEVRPENLECPKCGADLELIRWRFDADAEPQTKYEYRAACAHTWMNNALRESLLCLTIGVDRSLSYQLSYASKWTTLSKLMRRFHNRLVADPARVERLKTFYAGLLGTFEEVEEFSDFARQLRSATAEFGGNLPYGLGIDFSAYDPSNYFRSLRVFPQLDGEARSYDEFGTGQEQVLAMAFTYAYARAFGADGLVLAIEEPEAHLHPLAQEWVSRKLAELADAGAQVVITTHSPAFVNLETPGTTVLLRKAGEAAGTSACQLPPRKLQDELTKRGAPPMDAKVLGPYYENLATPGIKAALFSRRCVLVEGPTEESALPELFRRAGVDLVREGIAVVSVNGIENLPAWIRFFRAHGLPVYPIFDTDEDKRGEASKERAETRFRILESLSLEPVDGTDQGRGPIHAGRAFGTFAPDYERAMRATFGIEYERCETAARALVGRSKPLVARSVARELPHSHQGWASIAGLANCCTGE